MTFSLSLPFVVRPLVVWGLFTWLVAFLFACLGYWAGYYHGACAMITRLAPRKKPPSPKL